MFMEMFTSVVDAAHNSTHKKNEEKRYVLGGDSPFKSEVIVVGCYGIKKFNKKLEYYEKQGFSLISKPHIKRTYSRKYGNGVYITCTMRRVSTTYKEFPYGSIAAQKRADDEADRRKATDEAWDSLPRPVKNGIIGAAAVGGAALGGYILKELWENF